MLFHSFSYLIFFPIVVLAYFALPHRYRWSLLLISSYYFYMSWNPAYALLILFSTCVDYFLAKKIETTETKKNKRALLICSLLVNLGILFTYKYLDFLYSSLVAIAPLLGTDIPHQTWNLLLPVGISFYTFQSLSYTIDVYRGKKQAEKHFGIFALYVSFFPQLVAGPIERSTRLLPELQKVRKFDYQRICDGFKLILWGMFKKVVIADRVAVVVNQVFNNASDYSGFPLWIAAIFFAVQIYCDFSGYSDMAIGSAQVLGIPLMDNFKRPYFSKSIAEFWRRWHISLSTWFKDYLYIPLGGSRVSKSRWYLNIMITFVVSGLWHGANWTFVIWGALHGAYMIIGDMTKVLREKIYAYTHFFLKPVVKKIIRICATFILVDFAWIFFRANSLSDAMYIISNLFTDISISHFFQMQTKLFQLGLGKQQFLIAVVAIIIMESVHLLQRHQRIRHMLSTKPRFIRWTVLYIMILFVLFFGYSSSSNDFIYFQF